MSTSYPAGLDNLANPTGGIGETQSTVSHVAQHQNANDAIEAIEAILGINPHGTSSTVRRRLETIEAAITALGTSAYTSLPDGSITTAKLGTNAVTTAKIADDQITAAKLQTDSVSTAKIQNNAVTQAKLASNLTLTTICTSTTRPSSFAGLRIYETNTFRELLHDGTGWIIMSEPAQTFTPTTTNITLGNGTLTGEYHRSDGYCDFAITFVFGSTSSFTGTISFNLPIAAGGTGNGNGGTFNCLIYDASVGLLAAFITVNGTTALNPSYLTSFLGAYSGINATLPMTWAVNDSIWIKGRYKMTTRYS